MARILIIGSLEAELGIKAGHTTPDGEFTLEATRFLEINSSALGLSSDEVRERFNKVLLVKLLARLRGAWVAAGE